MSTLEESLKNPLFYNWVRGALALDFTKQAIVDFVVTTNDRSHADAIKDIPGACPSCDFNSWDSCMHNPCENKALRTAIISVYLNPCITNTPSFVNTTPKDCWSEPWEFAKCFMPVKGGAYKKCRSADDTDIAGILSVMTNNATFLSELSQIGLDQQDNIIRNVIDIRNKLMHNPSFEIDDQAFNEYITVINGLLNKLPVTTATKQGRVKIHEISRGNLKIESLDAIKRCINEAVDNLRSQSQELIRCISKMEQGQKKYTHEINKAKDKGIEEIKATIYEGKVALESKTQEGLEHIEEKTEQGMQKLDDKEDKATENITQKGQEMAQDIKRQKEEGESAIKKTVENEKEELQKKLLQERKQLEKCTEENKELLRTEINSIMQATEQAENVKGQIESKTDQINEITKECAKKLALVAEAGMKGIKYQTESLTERTISSHLVDVNQLVRNTTEKIDSVTDGCIERLQIAKHEAESLKVDNIYSRQENTELSLKITEMEKEVAEVKSTMSEKYNKKQYPFKRLDVTFQIEKSCSITGMVKVDANRLAVVDNQNKRIKIIDVHKNEIESSVQIKDPWDITRVSERQLIVSCGRMLQFLEHKDGNLTVGGKHIPIAGESKGIDFAGEKLIVTFTSPERAVRIIDMDGKILNTIHLKQFETPLYVKFGPDEQIFIADYDSQKVMCLDNAGSLKYPLTNNDLKGPHGLTIDGKGNVYISGYKTNNIHVIRINEVAPNLSKFLEEKDGMDRPQALAYCDIENKLYISQTESGTHIVSVHNGLNAVSPGDGDGSL